MYQAPTAFLCRVKGHTLTSCARRRGSRLSGYTRAQLGSTTGLVWFPDSSTHKIRACDASAFTSLLDSAYQVHWRRNCFSIPKGHVGKVFVNELARLFSAFASGSALEPVALKATIVLPHLVLQKPHRRSKPKDHASLLERRMKLWEQGDLLKEGRAIQDRFPSSCRQGNEQQVARSFARMMFQGKTQATLQLLTDQGKGGLLHLDDPVTPLSTIKDVLL